MNWSASIPPQSKTRSNSKRSPTKKPGQRRSSTIIARDDGMVVYANEQLQRRGGQSRMSTVEEGAMMIERQTIIKLPDLSQMQVKSTVHESKVDSLKRGMRARIRIQDHEYQGIV